MSTEIREKVIFGSSNIHDARLYTEPKIQSISFMLRPRILNDTSCGSYFVVGTNFAYVRTSHGTLFGGVELDTVYS